MSGRNRILMCAPEYSTADHVINSWMTGCAEPLKRGLAEHGFELIEDNITEFLKAGGSTKCLTLNLI